MHEQSETIQLPNGKWINVYGKGTSKAGQQLPGTQEFASLEEATGAAKQRSDTYGRKFGMQLNPEKLMMMAQEWDPGPFLEAIEQASAQQLPGLGGEEPTGMSYAQMLGQAPGQGAVPQGGEATGTAGAAPLPPALMQQIMGSMQGQAGQVPQAPAVAPSKPGMINFPSMNVPRGLRPPPKSFAELMQGIR